MFNDRLVSIEVDRNIFFKAFCFYFLFLLRIKLQSMYIMLAYFIHLFFPEVDSWLCDLEFISDMISGV